MSDELVNGWVKNHSCVGVDFEGQAGTGKLLRILKGSKIEEKTFPAQFYYNPWLYLIFIIAMVHPKIIGNKQR